MSVSKFCFRLGRDCANKACLIGLFAQLASLKIGIEYEEYICDVHAPSRIDVTPLLRFFCLSFSYE